MSSLARLAKTIASEIERMDREKGAKIPAPDQFDPELYPFGKRPGDNKYNLMTCPTCGKPPTETGLGACSTSIRGGGEGVISKAFLFRDIESAEEYYISGMCQSCQDKIFKKED